MRKKLKRALWLCFAGCCCAGLWSTGGTLFKTADAQAGADGTKQTLTTYCPVAIYWYGNGMYYYGVTQDPTSCTATAMIWNSQLYQTGCNCADPITTTSHPLPLPKSDDVAELAPTPDPMFSGVLR